MVNPERLAARKAEIAGAEDLVALRDHLVRGAQPLIERLPEIPSRKALLSRDGGVCPQDGAVLVFDPWSPRAHRCPRCGASVEGERHDRAWAKFQHLWLAERAAHLAAVAAFADDERAAGRAREILAAYGDRYLSYPNRDNVLGPARLFFSTYLESIWILNYLAAAALLRAAGRLDDATTRAVAHVADEAATLIGEFDEQFSNRQTWNNAALTAIAVWFEDEELARRAIEGETGLIAHLRGFRRDGLWYEGENYHLFALRGFLTGAEWALEAGVDVFADPEITPRVVNALLAPARTALPDFTFPARKDSRFGVSLAQPMYLELWEIGAAGLGRWEEEGARSELRSWLQAVSARPSPPAEQFESYLHHAGAPALPANRAPRTALSWWSLLDMMPALPAAAPWAPESVLLESQGLAILRRGDRYLSLECGPQGGGHGHPDRLHLTLHADGVHWLPDFGTGSYVSRDLFWYRSTLAHNAPRLDGVSQPPVAAVCEFFEIQGDWSWVRGRFGPVTRSVVAGPRYVIDVVELAGHDDRQIDVPWHLSGEVAPGGGAWSPAGISEDFITDAESFAPAGSPRVTLSASAPPARLTVHYAGSGSLWRATGPGRPGGAARETFYVVRARGRNLQLVTLLEPGPTPAVRAVRVNGDVIEVETAEHTERHRMESGAWEVDTPAGRLRLRGPREIDPPFAPIVDLEPPAKPVAAALRVADAPALDGTLAGFDTAEPLALGAEDQYRRSEESYSAPEDLAAVAYANWDEAALYLAVEVTKPDLCLRDAQAAPARLDNEPEDINSDGVQIYVRNGDDAPVRGYLVVPDARGQGLRVAGAAGTVGRPDEVRGGWARTDGGYRVTLALKFVDGAVPHVGGKVGFDLLVNEMVPGRERRAGQLVWSGGNGWVWLRGDRQDPERFGELELVG